MSLKNETVTTRISKVGMDIVKKIARINKVSDSEQISTIVKTYEYLKPSYIKMEGFIKEEYEKTNKEEEQFTYETLYILYNYAQKKNRTLKNYYPFASSLSKYMIVMYYIESHMEITEDYDGGKAAINSSEAARFLFGEAYEEFTLIAKDLTDKARKANDDIYMTIEMLHDYIYLLCLTNQKIEMIFLNDFVRNREQLLFKTVKHLKERFPDKIYKPYISFSNYFGIKDVFAKILIDYYQNPHSFVISSQITESLICNLLDNVHKMIRESKGSIYSKTLTAALKISLEVAKLEKYDLSYKDYFVGKLESNESNLLDALSDDIHLFDKENIAKENLAEYSARVPMQICAQSLSSEYNFLEFSRVRQVVNENFLDIFWPSLKYIIKNDRIPILLNPNDLIEYGGKKEFIGNYNLFNGSYTKITNNPFELRIVEDNLDRIKTYITYKSDDYEFEFVVDFETIDKLETAIDSKDNYFNKVYSSSTGVNIIITRELTMKFSNKNSIIKINKNIANKFFEIIKEFKQSPEYNDIRIVNRLHHGEV